MKQPSRNYEKKIAGLLAFPAIYWWLPAIMGILFGLAYESYLFAAFMIIGFILNLGWFLRFFHKLEKKKNMWFGFWTISALSGIFGAFLFLPTDFKKDTVDPLTWICISWWIYTSILSLAVLIKNIQNKSAHTTSAIAPR